MLRISWRACVKNLQKGFPHLKTKLRITTFEKHFSWGGFFGLFRLLRITWARIWKHFKEPRNRFPAWRYNKSIFRTGPPCYIGWRNRFWVSLNLYKYGLRAGIFKQSMGARHRVGKGFSYRPDRLHRLAESIPQNWFLDPFFKRLQIRALSPYLKTFYGGRESMPSLAESISWNRFLD